jgi:tRNA pseudouridine38-40 synthase
MSATYRWAVGLEYDGGAYAGWQTQESAPSIQSVAEHALAIVADHPVTLTGAGRTDAGVHAFQQVAHFDAAAIRSPRSWVYGANTHLPPDVAALWAVQVPETFHARYSALSRSYRYLILNRATRPALGRNRVCWMHGALDHERMAQAAAHLVGEHDYSAFRSSECQSRTPLRRVEAIEVRREGPYVIIEARANAFLHHMVRNIAGVLIQIGRGEADVGWAREVLEGRDRRLGGVTAPAGGLYLVGVSYPAEFGLPGPGDSAAHRPSFMIPHEPPDTDT